MNVELKSPSPAPPASGRHRFDGVVELNQFICREHYLLRIRIPGEQQGAFPKTLPGQFVQLGCRAPADAINRDKMFGHDVEWLDGQQPNLCQSELCGSLAFLRRPFSLAGRGDDEQGTWIDIIHRVVGVGTAWLENLNVGDAVDLIGPLGNAFVMPEDKSLGLLVGGGVGLPPMFYLAEALADAGCDAVGFVGAMTKDLLAVTLDDQVAPDTAGRAVSSVKEFARAGFPTVLTTDDGTLGLKGRITAGLEVHLAGMSDADLQRAVVFTCGPEPMMHAVAQLAERHDIPCQVCLEQSMACGMGTCQSCIVQIEAPPAGKLAPHGKTEAGRPWRYRLACSDGPVFDAADVIWE